MKVVLLHDWLTGFRGGERVLEAFCEMFPEAPLYTLLHQKGSVPWKIEQRKIRTSFLNSVPWIQEHYRKFLPLFPTAVDAIKIEEDADLILSSSHCVIKGVKKPVRAHHLSYVHSPMRYIYDQYDEYFGPHAPFYQRLGMKLCRSFLTRWDFQSNIGVDSMLANSHFVKERIKRHYGRDAEVVHPFVELGDFKQRGQFPSKKEDFYLMVGAFAPNKRVDLAIEAFNKMKKTLKIIGTGQQEPYLKKISKGNVHFLGHLGRSEVVEHFFKARAFLLPGVEDFGITPLEALAAGTPVIARRAGGVKETLNDKVSVLFDENNVQSLIGAVQKFESKSFHQDDLFSQAERFSKERFKEQIKEKILRIMQ